MSARELTGLVLVLFIFVGLPSIACLIHFIRWLLTSAQWEKNSRYCNFCLYLKSDHEEPEDVDGIHESSCYCKKFNKRILDTMGGIYKLTECYRLVNNNNEQDDINKIKNVMGNYTEEKPKFKTKTFKL